MLPLRGTGGACHILAMSPAPLKLDAIDLRILDAIQKDGRITKLALAERVGLSPTPCWLRLRKLEKAGIVTGYHARIAARKVAPLTQVIMQVTLGAHRQADFDRFEKAVCALPEVLACWSVGGGVDYFVLLATRDIETYQALVDRILAQEVGIDRYFTYVVTRQVKQDTGIPMVLFAGN